MKPPVGLREVANWDGSGLMQRLINASCMLLRNGLCARAVEGKVLDHVGGLTRVVIRFEAHDATAFFHIQDGGRVVALARDEERELWAARSLEDAVTGLEMELRAKLRERERFWRQVKLLDPVRRYPYVLSERERFFLDGFIEIIDNSINRYRRPPEFELEPELVAGTVPYVSLACVSLNSYDSCGESAGPSVLVLISACDAEKPYTFKGRGGTPVSLSTLPELETLLRVGAK